MSPQNAPINDEPAGIAVTVDAGTAPTPGTRVSIDYLKGQGALEHLTWLIEDPLGAWVVGDVRAAGPSSPGLVCVNLLHLERCERLEGFRWLRRPS